MPETVNTSEKGYKSLWVPGQLNKDFWSEVLVGKCVTGLKWNDHGIEALILDDGQTVFVIKNENDTATLCIKD